MPPLLRDRQRISVPQRRGMGLNLMTLTSRKKFFLPAKVLSCKFRGKFLLFLKQPSSSFPSNLYHKEWVVYCKPPFKSVGKVIEYLGRYTHRIAISNSRLLQVQDSKVSFSWRDYRDHSRKKVMTLSAAEFIRRFMLHVLPPGFCKIRHIFLPSETCFRPWCTPKNAWPGLWPLPLLRDWPSCQSLSHQFNDIIFICLFTGEGEIMLFYLLQFSKFAAVLRHLLIWVFDTYFRDIMSWLLSP